MRVIVTITNQKGGSAKPTTTVNLGVFARPGRKIILGAYGFLGTHYVHGLKPSSIKLGNFPSEFMMKIIGLNKKQ